MTEFLEGLNTFNLEAIFKMGDLDKKTQNHLLKVYSIIGSGILTSFAAGYLTYLGVLNPIVLGVLSFAIFAASIIQCCQREKSDKISAFIFYAIATLSGGAVGFSFNLLDNKADFLIFSKIVMTAFTYSVALFAIFTVFTIATKKRLMIFAASGATALVLGIISFFAFKTALEAILGVMIGCLYVIIDTQVIIFKAQFGAFEPFVDATNLFTDLFKIFVEIIKLLAANEDKKKEKKK